MQQIDENNEDMMVYDSDASENPETEAMAEDSEKQYGLPDQEYYMLVDDKIRKRKEERLQKKIRERNRIRNRLIAIVVVIGAIVFSFSGFFTVTSIMVEGNSYFTAEEIIAMSHAEPGHNIIYNADKSSIIDYLEANPYIKSAKVRRSLPGTLVIRVEEREQTAAIVYDEDYLIIDSEGVLLRKTRTEPKITIIEGIKVSKIKLGEKIEATDSRVLSNSLSILNAMIKGDLYFTRLKMTDLYVNAYIYEALLVKGTEETIVDAIDSGRLHKVVEDLFSKNIKRGTITITEEGYASFVPSVE